MSEYPINHCALVEEVEKAGLGASDFQEAVVARAAQIVEDAKANRRSKPHRFQAVEIVGNVIAQHVLEQGAKKIARDFNINLERLMELAASEHISSC